MYRTPSRLPQHTIDLVVAEWIKGAESTSRRRRPARHIRRLCGLSARQWKKKLRTTKIKLAGQVKPPVQGSPADLNLIAGGEAIQ